MTATIQNWAPLLCVAAVASLTACIRPLPDESETSSCAANNAAPIVDGTVANGYPEAALVDFQHSGSLYYCSGAVIAPRVVLTAGHCVAQASNWHVKAPFAEGQESAATFAAVFDYTLNGDDVNPKAHDVGLIFLDTPIQLNAYPIVTTSELASGRNVISIGRKKSGALSSTLLFASKPHPIADAGAIGFPTSYQAADFVEIGDSGGPDMMAGTHIIVAVNSGVGTGNLTGTEILARVDLVSGWIASQVAAHGGPSAPSTTSLHDPTPPEDQPSCGDGT